MTIFRTSCTILIPKTVIITQHISLPGCKGQQRELITRQTLGQEQKTQKRTEVNKPVSLHRTTNGNYETADQSKCCTHHWRAETQSLCTPAAHVSMCPSFGYVGRRTIASLRQTHDNRPPTNTAVHYLSCFWTFTVFTNGVKSNLTKATKCVSKYPLTVPH